MRYDCVVIWGNGIQHTREIMTEIRNHPDLEIVINVWYDIKEDMLSFIKKMYACDPAPWSHLEAKTKYLINSPKKIFFVLIKNHNPQEEPSPSKKHIQSQTLVEFKNKIRSQYNPRGTGNCGPPLPPGVLHEHVIHTTDYESQVNHELSVIGLKDLDYYRRHDNSEYFVPFHFDVEKFKEEMIDIDKIRISIIGQGIVKVEDSPYYQYLNGNKQPMENYIKSYLGTTLKEDHFPESLMKINEEFKEDYVNRLGQKCLPIVKTQSNIYVIQDGGHRVAVMKHKGYGKVKCLVI